MAGGLYTEVDWVCLTAMPAAVVLPDTAKPDKVRVALGWNAKPRKIKGEADPVRTAARRGSWKVGLARNPSLVKPSLLRWGAIRASDDKPVIVVPADCINPFGVRHETGIEGSQGRHLTRLALILRPHAHTT